MQLLTTDAEILAAIPALLKEDESVRAILAYLGSDPTNAPASIQEKMWEHEAMVWVSNRSCRIVKGKVGSHASRRVTREENEGSIRCVQSRTYKCCLPFSVNARTTSSSALSWA